MASTKITIDLGDIKYLKLLKLQAQETGSSMKSVVIAALEKYFSDKIETKALSLASEKIFEEWNSEEDSPYDHL